MTVETELNQESEGAADTAQTSETAAGATSAEAGTSAADLVAQDEAKAKPVLLAPAIVEPPAVAKLSWSEAALAELTAWRDRHIPNSPISRDTQIHNRVHDALTAIAAAIRDVKE